MSVAKGTSYRVAAEVARHKAGRVPPGRRSRRSPANEGQLVANWVDVCSEFVCAGQLPERWPHTIAVDSQNFRVNSGPHAGRGFHVLAAVGRRGPAVQPGPDPVLRLVDQKAEDHGQGGHADHHPARIEFLDEGGKVTSTVPGK